MYLKKMSKKVGSAKRKYLVCDTKFSASKFSIQKCVWQRAKKIYLNTKLVLQFPISMHKCSIVAHWCCWSCHMRNLSFQLFGSNTWSKELDGMYCSMMKYKLVYSNCSQVFVLAFLHQPWKWYRDLY